MMHRRSLLSGAAALAVTTALPAGVFADDVTDDERRLLARVPERARPFALRGLRDSDPLVREFFARSCTAAPDDLKWLEAVLNRHLTLFDASGARGRGLNAKRAVARGYFTEDAFVLTALAPVTDAEWDELVAREGIG